MPDPTVLILGCGIGGVAAARQTHRLVKDARVVVIDRDSQASFPPSYLWVVTGERRPEAIRRQRARLSRQGVEFVNAEVRQIDLANRYVRADSREFHYDYLIIALGAETALDTRPGLAEAAYSFYTLEGAERLGAALRYFSGGRIVITVAGLPYKCPPAPYEAAMLLEHYFHERRMRQKIDIQLFTPEAEPLTIAGPENSEALRSLLAHKGIGLNTGRRLVSADPHRHEVYFEDGEAEPFQMLIAVPEHRAPAVVREAELPDATGWVPVSPATLETSQAGVFAIGDVNYLPLAGGGMLPKAGGFAEEQGRVAARNIAYRIKGGKAPPPYDGTGRCFLEVGAGAAVEIGGDFLASQPRIVMKQPSIAWHLAKVAAERYWLWRTY